MLDVDIKKSFPGFDLQVSFSSDEEILGVLGPSGSGKTMTLQCIAGLMRPDEGRITLGDRVLFDDAAGINLPARERRVGLVFQNYALFPHLTVNDNIAFGIRSRSHSDRRRTLADLTATMELTGLAQRYPEQLSAGQQQRVALARALASEPDILLLDEPLSALDASTRERLEPYILALKRFYRGTILFVTHDISEAYRLSSRIAVYEAGRIAQCAEKARVIASPANLTVARLTGFRNIFAGEIRSMTESSFLLDIPGLGLLSTVRHANSCLAPGMAVNIGIRSEHVEIAGHPGENTVRGTIENTIDEMASTRRIITVKNGEDPVCRLEAMSPRPGPAGIPSPGSDAHFYLPPEHIIVINQRD